MKFSMFLSFKTTKLCCAFHFIMPEKKEFDFHASLRNNFAGFPHCILFLDFELSTSKLALFPEFLQ